MQCSSASSSSSSSLCGNNDVDAGETCDDGNTKSGDGCSPTCKEEFCGDGVTQPENGEQCDVGGYCQIPGQPPCTDRQACPINPRTGEKATCAPLRTAECKMCISNTCGDGETQIGTNQCDDGKHCSNGATCSVDADCAGVSGTDTSCKPRGGDGCSAYCTPEFCGDGAVTTDGTCEDGSYCSGGQRCADGKTCVPREQCEPEYDDENFQPIPTMLCNDDCTKPLCGDKKVNPAYLEQCDDGMHCANGTECAPGSTCSDGSVCQARGPENGKPNGIATCSKSCRALEYKKCCTCQYAPQPECAGRTQAKCTLIECNDRIDNDGDGKIDAADGQCNGEFGSSDASESELGVQRNECSWDVATGSCLSRFEVDCKEDMQRNACDTTRTFPLGTPVPPYPASPVCTITHDTVEEHSHESECPNFIQDVRSCITCNTASCQRYTHEGCRTFADLDLARAEAATLRSMMRRRGIHMVIVEGHQMLSSATCRSIATLKITEKTIEEDFGPCGFGNYCFEQGETYKCKDANGAIVNGVCCGNPTSLYPPYVRIRAISDPPVCPEPLTEGTCSHMGMAMLCADARTAAWNGAETSCASKQADCLLSHPSGSFSKTCEEEIISSSWFPLRCSINVSCNWTCSW